MQTKQYPGLQMACTGSIRIPGEGNTSIRCETRTSTVVLVNGRELPYCDRCLKLLEDK